MSDESLSDLVLKLCIVFWLVVIAIKPPHTWIDGLFIFLGCIRLMIPDRHESRSHKSAKPHKEEVIDE